MQHAADAAPFVTEVAHTADVGFEVTAPTLAGCVERAVLALAALLAEPRTVAPRAQRTLEVEGDGLTTLLHDLLHAVLLLAQVDGFLVAGAEVQAIDAGRVSLLAAGEPYDPARHRLGGEVKAVTWHELGIERAGSGWRARVILDV